MVALWRGAAEPAMGRDRDIYWKQFLAQRQRGSSEAERLASNEPAFIPATSGTTATPRPSVHSHGGYQVYIHATGDWVFGLGEDDLWWPTSDIGRVVGHSYRVDARLGSAAFRRQALSAPKTQALAAA